MKNPKHTEFTYADFSLVNKLTGRRASSTTWLLDLAAVAVIRDEQAGLPSLLPQSHAKKLLKKNRLKSFKRHNTHNARADSRHSHSDLRELAEKALPYLAIFYIENVVYLRKPSQINKKGFRFWLVKELNDETSPLNNHLAYHPEFRALTELNRSEDWWRKRQKTTKNRE